MAQQRQKPAANQHQNQHQHRQNTNIAKPKCRKSKKKQQARNSDTWKCPKCKYTNVKGLQLRCGKCNYASMHHIHAAQQRMEEERAELNRFYKNTNPNSTWSKKKRNQPPKAKYSRVVGDEHHKSPQPQAHRKHHPPQRGPQKPPMHKIYDFAQRPPAPQTQAPRPAAGSPRAC